MSRIPETTDADPAAAAEQIRQTLTGRHICPYCGHQTSGSPEPCPHCTMEDTPATRQATKARIGPWYVLQSRNPAAPGMRYATLLALINKGQITPRSVIRGPTTHQLWRFAAHVRGISREFSLCYSCGGAIERDAIACPHCQRSQEAPAEPDMLLESRSNTAIVPAEPAAEPTPSYAARVRELNRRREQGVQESQSSAAAGTGAPRRAGSGIVSAMELAAALQDESNQSVLEAPPRRKLKIAAVLLVLLIGGAAAAFYLLPDYRQPALDWLNNAWANVKVKIASVNWPKSSGLPIAKPAVADDVKPAPERLLPYSAPIAEPPAPQPQVEVVEKPAPQKPVAQAPPTPQLDPLVALDESRKLWGQAIDEEARQDFAGAVKKYQQIKQLPSDVWPAGLQLRLDMAQRRAAETSVQ